MKQSQNKKFINVYIREKTSVPAKRLQECFTVRVGPKRPLFIFLLFYNMHTRFTSPGTGTCPQPEKPLVSPSFFFLIARDLTKKKNIIKTWCFIELNAQGFVAAFIKCVYEHNLFFVPLFQDFF